MVKIEYDLNDNNIIQEYKLQIDDKVERYNTEIIIPKNKDKKCSIMFVLGNPAKHSVENGFPYSYAGNDGNKRRHPFWGKLREAGILKELKKIHEMSPEDIRQFGDDFKRGEYNGKDYADCHVCIYPFYSFPTKTKGGVKELGDKFGDNFEAVTNEEKKRFRAILKNKIEEGSLLIICTKEIEGLGLKSIAEECGMEYKFIK